MNIADREHFRVQAAATEDRLFISKPVIGRSTGRLSVQFTRRMSTRTARFAGVVVASFDPLVIGASQSGFAPTGGFALLIGGDGIIRAARPDTALIGGHVLRTGATEGNQCDRDGGVAGWRRNGNRRSRDRQLSQCRRLSLFVVAAGFPDGIVFASYEHERHIILAAARCCR